MTAFAAFVAFDNSPAPDGVEKRLGAALEGVGLERLRVVRLPGAVFVCRQRLLAPEDRHEAQPWQGNSGIVSLFDGRLDNRFELIERLGLRSAQGSDIGDGHLAMLLYERFGPDAAQHLLGDFAWAVWDPRARRLSLARDHSQHRALFHAGEKGWRAFATGYRPLLTLPQVPTDVDELAVAELLLTCTDTSDRSFYKAIRHVRPATQVQFGPEGESSRILWRPDYDREARAERTAGDHVEQMRLLFESAVAARTRVIGPVVSSVSGGLDSSAIAATAARQCAPSTVHALCVVPVDGEGLSLRVERKRTGWTFTTRGASHSLRVLTPRVAALSHHMIEKVPPDLSRFLLCPMPGLVTAIHVAEGAKVEAGQPLAVVEAMKMENILRAEKAGTVKTVAAKPGDSLAVDAVILEFE